MTALLHDNLIAPALPRPVFVALLALPPGAAVPVGYSWRPGMVVPRSRCQTTAPSQLRRRATAAPQMRGAVCSGGGREWGDAVPQSDAAAAAAWHV
jgi:hypothetical protein